MGARPRGQGPQHAPRETDTATARSTHECCFRLGRDSRFLRPPLVIHGERDAITPVHRGETLAQLVGGELVILRGSGHEPQTRIPATVNRIIDGFLGDWFKLVRTPSCDARYRGAVTECSPLDGERFARNSRRLEDVNDGRIVIVVFVALGRLDVKSPNSSDSDDYPQNQEEHVHLTSMTPLRRLGLILGRSGHH